LIADMVRRRAVNWMKCEPVPTSGGHWQRGDYTRWFRDSIKDNDLAEEVESLESSADPMQSRASLAASVKRRYAAAETN
jgi:hypothetical protein